MVTLGIACLASTLVGAQQPTPDFRSGVETVRIDFRALDASGHFVEELTAADLRVFEDGREQPITSFARVALPPPETSGRAGFTDNVSSNARPSTGRNYVILIDDMNLHPFRVPTVQAIASQFIERHIGAGDLVAMTATSGNGALAHEFTGNRARLQKLLSEWKQTSVLGAREEIVMRSLRQVVEWVGGSSASKKSVVFISEGVPYDLRDPFASGTQAMFEVLDEMRDMLAAAARTNVNVFTISPVGQPSTPPSGSITPLKVVGEENQADRVWRESRESLQAFAEETGGFALVMSNAFEAAFERIVDENSRYYLVGFTPETTRTDRKFHGVEVRVNRPGVTVQARRGYVARDSDIPKRARPPKQLPTRLGEALQHPLPVTALPLTVTTTLSATGNKRVRVGVVLETEPHERPYDVFVAAASADGKVKDSMRLQVNGTRTDFALSLPKGRYHLRVAAVEPDGRQGSVFHDFDVPE